MVNWTPEISFAVETMTCNRAAADFINLTLPQKVFKPSSGEIDSLVIGSALES